jgi:hypothetical protein
MHNLCNPCVNALVIYDADLEGCTCQHNWGVWMRIYDRLDLWRCIGRELLIPA